MRANLKRMRAGAVNNMGLLHANRGNIEKALECYHQSLEIKIELGDKRGEAVAYNNIGMVHDNKGGIPKALEYYEKSLHLREVVKDTQGIAISLNNIGSVYEFQEEYETALEYFQRSVDLRIAIGDDYGAANALNNIGSVYKNQEEYHPALVYYRKSLKLYKNIGYEVGIGSALSNIGVAFESLGYIDSALPFFQEALELQISAQDIEGMGITYRNLADIQFAKGEFFGPDGAVYYGERSYDISRQIGYVESIKNSALTLSQIYEETDQSDHALKMLKTYYQMRDSILSEENQKLAIKQAEKYKYEAKKAIDDLEHEKKLAVQEQEKATQRLVIIFVVIGMILLITFLIFAFNRLKVTRRQNEEINTQKQEIERTHSQLAEHHKEISDSIKYAKRIQTSIMPSMDQMHSRLRNCFVLYQPKDVVAGDFYWMEPHPEDANVMYFAAADCTGHGVPGAMVSMVCSKALTKVLTDERHLGTAEILNRTREIVIESFTRGGEQVYDGMDISLYALNMTTRELEWTGANNALWIIKAGVQDQGAMEDLVEIRADKQPVGLFDKSYPFSSTKIQLEEGDLLYSFTDGFQDQFGGPKRKKFKSRNLKKLLLKMKTYDLEKQKSELIKAFAEWKGDLEQIDDVCIIGVRV